MLSERLRGFIAAPLLGTLIFLSAIVFVAHVTQVDKTETASIVSEAYHNRIVNILEDYRSDLGVIFSVNVVRAIQRYLTSECWNLFTLSNKPPQRGRDEPNLETTQTAPVGILGANNKINYDNLQFCNNAPAGGAAGCSAAVARTNDARPNSFLCVENCNAQLDYHELRYQKCTQISEIIKDGICPYNQEYGITAWIDSTLGTPTQPGNPSSPRVPYSFEGVSFSIANEQLVKTFIDKIECQFEIGGARYRMPFSSNMVLRDAADTTICRGTLGFNSVGESDPYERCKCNDGNACSKETTNGEFQVSQGYDEDCGGKTGVVVSGEGIRRCRELIGNPLFDCRNFAVPETDDGSPFRCCSKFYSNPSNPADENNGRCCDGSLAHADAGGCQARKDYTIPGCEEGNFFINVNLLASDDLYKRVPRVNAKDNAGNTIQGGALGQQSFTVQVKYPVYKYLDAAMLFYSPFAYGTGGSIADFLDTGQNTKKHGGTGRQINLVRKAPKGRLPAGSGGSSGGGGHTGSGGSSGSGGNGGGGHTGSGGSSGNGGNGGEGGAEGAGQEFNTIEFQQGGGGRGSTQGGGGRDQDAGEGVIEGICFGKKCEFKCSNRFIDPGNDCTLQTAKTRFDRKATDADPPVGQATNTAAKKRQANQVFYNNFLNPNSPTGVCRLVKPPLCEQLDLCKTEVWIRGYNLGNDREFLKLCPTPDPRIVSAFSASASPASTANLFAVEQCQDSDPIANAPLCAFMDALYLTLDFRDFDEKNLVQPDPPANTKLESPLPHNRFCWYAYPFHYRT